MRTKEENKRLCEEMPYLIPRNVFSGKIPEDYNYSYIVSDYFVPEGWRNLFIQMCRDIKEPLEKAGYLDKFMFSQIKEKYGHLCAYNFGATEEVQDIISKYEHISGYICEKCGKPSTRKNYTVWIEQYCDECAKTVWKNPDEIDTVKYKPIMEWETWDRETNHTKVVKIDTSDIWERYINEYCKD